MLARKNAHIRFYLFKARTWSKGFLDKQGKKDLKLVYDVWLTIKDILLRNDKTKQEGLNKACIRGKQ